MSIHLKRMLCLAATAIAVLTWRQTIASQQRPTGNQPPLTLQEVEGLLKDGVPAARIRQLASDSGVAFILDADGERRLRMLGVPASLIELFSAPVPAAGRRWTPPIDRREMVGIGPGTLLMGSVGTESGRDDDEGQHSVEIRGGFWLDTNLVTNEAYSRFLAQNPAWRKDRIESRYADGQYLSDWLGSKYPEGTGNWPVANLSWHAAAAYAAWAGKRLPTEAEWEYACRAGTTTAFWWGPTFDSSRANNGDEIQPVGENARRNPWDLYDMLGNVWQWTSSMYQRYPYRVDAREDPLGERPRVVRGGSWGGGAETFLRAANRNSLPPTATSPKVGFRCAR